MMLRLEERNEENEIIVCRRSLGQEQTGCSDSRDRSRGFSLLFLSDQAVREEIVADGYIDRLAGSIRQILLLTKSNLEKRSTWSIDPPLILLLRPSILPLPRGAPSDLHFHITLLTPPSDSHIQTSLSPPLDAPPRADGSRSIALFSPLPHYYSRPPTHLLPFLTSRRSRPSCHPPRPRCTDAVCCSCLQGG
jgi:hypothetical protein